MQCNLCRNTLSLMEEISNEERRHLKPIYDALYEAVVTEMCAGLTDEYDFRTGTAAIKDHVHASIHRILLDNISKVFTLAAIEEQKRNREGQEGTERLASLVQSIARAVARERG
jgi:ribosomal protein L23